MLTSPVSHNLNMNAVTLETERLRLRMFREDDFESYASICADAEVMRYIATGKPFTRLEAWRHKTFLIGHWQLRGYGPWAVEEKSSRRMIGRIGFLDPDGWPGFEIGWTLAREVWGKGYATEGARRAMEYAFTELNQDQSPYPSGVFRFSFNLIADSID